MHYMTITAPTTATSSLHWYRVIEVVVVVYIPPPPQ